MIDDYIMPFVWLFVEMAPYLLLGFLIAGILHAFVPGRLYRRWLGGNDARSVLLSIAIGVPLPLCSCGVIPTAVGMRKDGASKGAVTAFLIATPQTGVDSIAATWSVFGLPFAILRPVAALVTGLFGGLAVNVLDKGRNEARAAAAPCAAPELAEAPGFIDKCRAALKYGFGDMIQDIGRWLIAGLFIAGLITVFVPDGFFTSYAGNRFLNMFVVLLAAAPMYVCATGSIPIAAALMLKGLSPGAALVFLMAGPATNVASMMILSRTLGRRSLVIYLLTILSGALIFGFATDSLLPPEWFSMPLGRSLASGCCHGGSAGIPWWQTASSAVLALLLARGLYMRLHGNKRKNIKSNNMTYKITGMACNHCKANVERGLGALEGVTSVKVDLASGTADVEGTAAAQEVIRTVESLGYGCNVLATEE